MRTGPNDARRVVWALGEFFLSFFRLFLIPTYNEKRDRVGRDDKNRPKRRVWRRLGPR